MGCKGRFYYNELFYYCAACGLRSCKVCAEGRLLNWVKECLGKRKTLEISSEKWEIIGVK